MERDDDELFSDGEKKEMSENKGMDEEGLLPKALMAGKDFKVGDEIVLEITRIGEKDFSVKYASEKGEKEEHKEEMPEKETADMGGGGGSESDAMMY